MKAILAAWIALAAPAAAQWLVDPASDSGRRLIAAFDDQWRRKPERPMACRFGQYPPFLDYSLRVWSGYTLSAPAAALMQGDPPREVITVARVTPLEPKGEAAHLYQRLSVPDPPPGADLKKVEMSLGGGWLLGRGKYRVEMLVMTTAGGECRAQSTINVREDSATLAPGMVGALDSGLWQGFNGEGRGHAAIFLHASPVRPRRYVTRLSPWDRQVLLSTLNAVLREAGFRSASLTVFDLMKREVVFEAQQVRPEDVGQLARQLARIDYGTIPLQTLKDGPLPGDFLQDLVRRGLRGEPRPDALIFIGARWRGGPKVKAMDPALKEASPPAFHLAYSLPNTPEDTDALTSLVKGLGGKVFSIYLPRNLAPALRQIRESRP
ncbi:MAG: hypothetical protein KatS3mg005_1667 [Bryobacteraceae bacterium]|nr:MAG: hypothetical protein KatS3mg005_1667 [Bryobacteraceae bacterium]